jgi:predicted MFS family arabinose efflux permease
MNFDHELIKCFRVGRENMENNFVGKRYSYRLLVLALVLAVFATYLLNMLLSVYLKDMATTFGVAQGVASQLSAIASLVSIPVAIVLGFLTLRYNHKYLLLAGLVTIVIGLIGVYLAPNFTIMQIFYPLDGVGSPIVGVVAIVMMGDLLPLEKKGKTMGWALGLGALSYIIGVSIGGLIVNAFGTWRSILPVFAIPVTIAAFVLVALFIPSKPFAKPVAITKQFYFAKFKSVLTNRSTLSCYSGTLFRVMLPIMGGVFGAAFFRTYWGISRNTTLLIVLGWVLTLFVGTLIGGYLLNRGGRKRLTVAATLLEALFVISFVLVPISWGASWVWVAVALSLFAPLASGIGNTAVSCLYLELVPEARGPLMSLRTVSQALGGTIGVVIAGYLLDSFGYQMIGITLGVLGLVGGLIFLLLVKDPTRKQKQIGEKKTAPLNASV